MLKKERNRKKEKALQGGEGLIYSQEVDLTSVPGGWNSLSKGPVAGEERGLVRDCQEAYGFGESGCE